MGGVGPRGGERGDPYYYIRIEVDWLKGGRFGAYAYVKDAPEKGAGTCVAIATAKDEQRAVRTCLKRALVNHEKIRDGEDID